MRQIIALHILIIASINTFAVTKLSFDDALSEIIKRDTGVAKNSAYYDSSKTETLSKTLSFLPSLSLSKKYSRDLKQEINSEGLSIVSSVNLFKFGVDYSKLKVAKNSEKVALITLDKTILDLQTEATQVLLNVIETYQKLSVAERWQTIKKSFLDITIQRYKKGLTSSQEVQKVQIDYNHARESFRDSVNNFEIAKDALIAKLGHADIDLTWPWKKQYQNGTLNKIASAKFSLENSLEYQLAEKNIEIEQSKVSAIKSSFLPRIDLTYSHDITKIGGHQSQTEDIALLSLSMPIFEGLSTYSDYRAASANLTAAKQTMIYTNREVEKRFNQVQKRLLYLLQTLKEREETLRLSQSLYQDNYKRFETGRVSIDDLAIDQSRLLESENLSIQGQKNLHEAVAEICTIKGVKLSDCF